MPAPAGPRLNIGLPVYNGEAFLAEAIESLLGQSYADFDLIISDNASTDRTREICQVYAASDRRIRYYRNTRNLGAALNFNRTFELSNGEYFKWAAYDDLLAPQFVSQCIEALDQDPSIVLCYSKTAIIDEKGQHSGTYETKLCADAPTPHERFRDLISIRHPCMGAFGVVRKDLLAKTPLIGKYVGSDNNLLAEIGLYGRLFEIPEYLYFRRDHPQTTARRYNVYERLAWFDPKKTSRLHFPNWRTGLEYFKSVLKVPLTPYERYRCLKSVAFWFFCERARLATDVKVVASQFLPRLIRNPW